MRKNYWMGTLCCAAAIVFGCSDDNHGVDVEQIWQEERETIWKYLDEHADGEVTKYAYTFGDLTDTIYIFGVEGGSGEAGAAPWALVDYDLYTIARLSGERGLYDSSNPAYCAGEGIEASYRLGGPIVWAADTRYVDGVLPTFVKAGGSGKAIIHSRLLGGNAGTSRLFEMSVREFIDDLLRYEYAQMEAFAADSGLDMELAVKLPLREGETDVAAGDTLAYLCFTNDVDGVARIAEGDTVGIQARAYVLDSYNDPLREVFGEDEDGDGEPDVADMVVRDNVLPGLRLAVLQMGQGDEAWVLMPSRMAWGSAGDNYVGVPPYSAVAYWLKIVEHRPKK